MTEQQPNGRATAAIPSRRAQYQECHERIAHAIASGMETFVKIGGELKQMRALYDAGGYKTFEAYCKGEWGWSRNYTNRTIRAAEIRPYLPELPPMPERVDGPSTLNWTEWSVRPLTTLDTIAQVKAVAGRVVKRVEKAQATGEKVSLVALVKMEVEAAKERRPEKPPPDLHEVLAATVNHKGSQGQLRGDTMSPQETTLPEEITKKQSSRAQALAELPWEEITEVHLPVAELSDWDMYFGDARRERDAAGGPAPGRLRERRGRRGAGGAGLPWRGAGRDNQGSSGGS
jgi:hypothetical protein